MKALEHLHKESCNRGDIKEWVVHVAPDVLWYRVEDVGSYQGSLYGVGSYRRRILLYFDYYGSCGGCGAWGEGGGPDTQADLLKKSSTFSSVSGAVRAWDEETKHRGEVPEREPFIQAIKAAWRPR